MQDKSIAILVYTNLDILAPTINTIRLLENEYKVVTISRNVGDHEESFSSNTKHYKVGKKTSARASENKLFISKLIEYFSFTLKVLFSLRRHKCYIIIACDPYSLASAMVMKTINPQIDIFYHAHEIIIPESSKWYNLRYWMEKNALRYAKQCVWVSQPDIKRSSLFLQQASLSSVHTVRNFALKGSNLIISNNRSVQGLKKAGYLIAVYAGSINDYIEDIDDFIETTDLRIAVVIAGTVWDREIESRLLNRKNNNNTAVIIYLGFLPRQEMLQVIRSADFGLVLYRERYNTKMSAGSSAKVGDYISFGLPVIYPSYWEYEPYYKEIGLGYSDREELINRIKQLCEDVELRKRLSENTKNLFLSKLNFENEFEQFKKTIDNYMEK